MSPVVWEAWTLRVKGDAAGFPAGATEVTQVKRRFRLTSSADFKRVRRSGRSFAHPLVVLIALLNGLDTSRFGVAAGRSVGNAVRRNRAKRLIREALRPLVAAVPPGWDILLIAREPITRTGCQETQEAILALLKRARLLVSTDVNGSTSPSE